jgi:hypothetical protein
MTALMQKHEIPQAPGDALEPDFQFGEMTFPRAFTERTGPIEDIPVTHVAGLPEALFANGPDVFAWLMTQLEAGVITGDVPVLMLAAAGYKISL